MTQTPALTPTHFHSWGEHPAPPETTPFTLGPLTLWASVQQNDLWVTFRQTDPTAQDKTARAEAAETEAAETEASREEETAQPSPPVLTEDADWKRWALTGEKVRIRFTPEFPDRSVIVKPEYPFNLSPQAEARIYVHCPVWCKVEMVGERTTLITEIPTVVLSNTWFGTFTSGELCYWLSSKARRGMEGVEPTPHLVACPVHIRNRSQEELPIEKICLRVRTLSIYRDHERMWADESTVTYRGGAEFSRIEVAGVPPREAAQASLLSPPRDPGTRSLIGKTFSTIKDIGGLSIL